MSTSTSQCPICRATNAHSSVNCIDCKGRLPWADKVEQAQAQAIASQQQSSESGKASPAESYNPSGGKGQPPIPPPVPAPVEFKQGQGCFSIISVTAFVVVCWHLWH